MTRSYLEVARASAGPLAFLHSSGDLERFVEDQGLDAVVNALFGVVSITVIYSYLAVESRVNYLLYRLWERRHDGSAVSKQFLNTLGEKSDFASYRTYNKTRDLPMRIKTLCRIMGFQQPYVAVPNVWQEFLQLSQQARHYLIHPFPDPKQVQYRMSGILNEVTTGKWVSVAASLLAFLYREGRQEEPDWLRRNTLLRFEGIRLLPDNSDTV